nr:putative reverse transcriptase domain-containing protein [Tanacetum cinerariifolium]
MGKGNVVADALSRKERLKPRRVRAMSITIHFGLKTKILEAQVEASKDLKAPAEWLRGLETHFERRDDDGIYFFDQIWIPSVSDVRKLIMDKAHTSGYSVHPGVDKMYYNLRELYWWPDYKTEKLAKIYINEIVARHDVPVSISSERDGRFASHIWQALQKALGTRLYMSTAYHHQTDSHSESTIQTLEDMLRACVMDFGGSCIELLSDYESEIKYHMGKGNVVADALSRKERLKPRRVRAMSITIHFGLKTKILEAQVEASKDLKAPAEWLRGLETHFERRDDDGIYFFDQIWIPSVSDVRKLIMDKAHTSGYSVHPGVDKMYYNLRELYWWPDYKTEKLAKIYINEIVARHDVPVSISSERDGRFASHIWQALQKALGTRLYMSTAYHHQTDSHSESTIQTLEDMLRACVMDFGGSCNFSSIWKYTTMMLPRVRKHHGENVYIQDLVEFDVTMSTSMGK